MNYAVMIGVIATYNYFGTPTYMPPPSTIWENEAVCKINLEYLKKAYDIIDKRNFVFVVCASRVIN